MRRDILEREAQIREWVAQHRPKAFMCRELHCKPLTLDGYLKKFGLNYQGNKGGKGKTSPYRKSASQFLYNGSIIKSLRLKQMLLREGLKAPLCERCQGGEWLGEPMPLELHHVNGNPFDNRIENLQVLCPNCHALTDNHAGRGVHRVSRAGVAER
ncbi:MAG: HNH endonuclease [Pyrinomonadaceae bacterium]